MIKLYKYFLILFTIAVSTHSFAQNDTMLIRQSFNDLKMALLESDASKVIGLIDKNTFAFYSKMLLKAKTYDSVQVENLFFFEKLLIFTIRLKDEKDNIRTMNDSSFFQYAIKNKMMEQISGIVGGSILTSVNIYGDSAMGQLMLDTTFISLKVNLPYQVKFRLENKQWKVDIAAFFPVLNLAFKQMVFNSKKTDTEFLVSIIKSGSILKDERILWKPLNK
ncbi:MAG: hypothetical protein QM802_26805 [Agriterribacter sp.]